ncbi:hypothetical protein [Paraglaciecola sp. L3A3]|uniref:hypothetical protein n=1 Tax=Paraglaciecola sp. L3A3 TaxID=2686358 RepID=UPI00131C4709|nr:hypothetical protein [Paraglaciecola sp. L3A3]
MRAPKLFIFALAVNLTLLGCAKHSSLTTEQLVDLEYGDPGWVFDEAKADPKYPDMVEWAKAGVRGGIPFRDTTPIVKTINPGTDNIQGAIDQVKNGGVIILKSGAYTLNQPVYLKSNIILRGETGDPKDVIININFRQTWQGWASKRYGLVLDDVNNAGIEDLTLFYLVPGLEPKDNDDYSDKWVQGVMNNDVDRDDLYVGLISLSGTTSDSWVDNCRLLEAGTDPILTGKNTKHLTFRNNFVDRAYNKGGRGNAYFDMRGQYILVTGNTIKRVRHLAIEMGAKYVVVYNNQLEVDVNFHQGDLGHNLVENNTIRIPEWHRHKGSHNGWAVFAAGNSGMHLAAGEGNKMFKNVSDLRNTGAKYADPNVVYTTVKYHIEAYSETPPLHNTLYAIKPQGQ